MSEPLKVSISPKAMRTLWCISANGGQTKPAVSIAHPKMHNATAVKSCTSFMVQELGSSYLHLSPNLCKDITTEGLVLGLVLEAQLIARDLLWVKHTLKSSSCTLCELLTVEQLR